MADIIIFMSAYDTTKYIKSKVLQFGRKQALPMLFNKYHIKFMLKEDKLISSIGVLKLSKEYDSIQQKTNFSFKLIKDTDNIENYSEVIGETKFCMNLLHAQSVLADTDYFKIDYFICMEQFLVSINNQLFQIDPVIFSMNRTLIIAYEVIEFDKENTLNRDDVLGRQGNYNLKTVENYQFFGDEKAVIYNGKISEDRKSVV